MKPNEATITGAAWLEKLANSKASEEEAAYYKSAFQEICEEYRSRYGCFPTRLEFFNLTVPTLETAQAQEKKSAPAA
jgi:hypothetical protein